jgi:tetratricopeptide (TPR) repeat protein
LAPQKQAELAQSHLVNPEAFDAYLQGYYYFERDSDKDTELAARYFERATQVDPSYALAWAGLSRARLWQVNVNLIPAEEGRRLAREAVERALTLNPNLPEAHAQMGRIQQQIDFDWTGAAASFKRAMALDPGSPGVIRTAAFSAALLGRFDEALPLNRRAIDLDPLNADSWEERGELEYYEGEFAGAEADFKQALELNPDVVAAHELLARTYLMQGRPHDALPEIEFLRYGAVRGYLYAIAYHALGREKKSDSSLSEFIEKYHSGSAYQIAEVYAFRNQTGKAFEWLDRAYTQHDGGLIGTKVNPLLKNLHSDPRFPAFLEKIHLLT